MKSLPYFQPYKYLKDESFDPFYSQVNTGFFARARIMPVAVTFLGAFILVTQVALPLFAFSAYDDPPEEASNTVLGIVSGFSEFEFGELKSAADAETRRENVLRPVVNRIADQASPAVLSSTSNITGTEAEPANIPDYFYLSIPRLGIKDAKVKTNSEDLSPDDYLGHYEGSALPGETGNTFIYGHSVLPWFFNSKNYKTIFSTLDKLSEGDQIIIKYNNRRMAYKVTKRFVEDPEKVDPLAEYKPRYLNDSTITLMTCVPPGTKLKRLLVVAEEVK